MPTPDADIRVLACRCVSPAAHSPCDKRQVYTLSHQPAHTALRCLLPYSARQQDDVARHAQFYALIRRYALMRKR